jgi:thiol-disulfide isomerase/thioredoxin
MACLAALPAYAQSLKIGDKAPSLEVSRWVKGEKVERLEKDQTYVVEFWATWCGPCIQTIPHLTKLQKEFKDKGIKFIGVSVWEQDPKAVDPFVKHMGDKMVYSVAMDEVPKDEEPNNGKMAKNWMAASGAQGIPTAFIVKDGLIAWIGHPGSIDKPLEKVTEPNFDLAKFISDARERQAKQAVIQKKLEAFQEKFENLGINASQQKMLELFVKTTAESPELEEELGNTTYELMFFLGEKNTSNYGLKLVEGVYKDNAEMLNQIAWLNLDPDSNVPADRRDYKLALKAAIQANELTKGTNGAIADSLALAYFKTGDPVKALAIQEKVIKLTEADGLDGEEEKKAFDEMKARLEEYKKAVAEAKKP